VAFRDTAGWAGWAETDADGMSHETRSDGDVVAYGRHRPLGADDVIMEPAAPPEKLMVSEGK
jgi:hypothetical protein